MPNSPQLHIFVAGDDRSVVQPRHLWTQLIENDFIEHGVISNVGFCRTADGSLIVVLPKAFQARNLQDRLKHDQDFRTRHVFRLVRLFRKTIYDTNCTIQYVGVTPANPVRTKTADPLLDSLEAAIRLRADYRRNGLWLPKRRTRVRNSPAHTITWPTTIRLIAPLLDAGTIIFPETIHEKRIRDPSHILSCLHAYALRDIFARTGETHFLRDIPQDPESRNSPVFRNPIPHLRALRRQIFSDRGRLVLGYLDAYLGDRALLTGAQPRPDDTLGFTTAFERIWEHILSHIFTPNAKHRFQLPQGKWFQYPDANAPQPTKAPMTDVVLDDDSAFAIIDAKDYALSDSLRVFNGSRLAGSHNDHYKQIIYRHLMMAQHRRDATNILAFPSFGQPGLFALAGCHLWDGLPQSAVFEVYVDYERAVKSWIGEERCDIVASLHELVTNINGFKRRIHIANPALQL